MGIARPRPDSGVNDWNLGQWNIILLTNSPGSLSVCPVLLEEQTQVIDA